MAKAKRGVEVPLAPGDYVLPGHVYVSLRLTFLETVSTLVPEAIASLRAVQADDEAALQAWAARWHLTDDWVLDTARRHLERWRDYPEYAGRWLTIGAVDWEPVPPALNVSPWRETKAAFLARAAAAYDAAAVAAGATETPRKRAESGRHLEWLVRHHVAGETLQSIAETGAEDTWVSTAAVSLAVAEMATLIGLARS